jgi:hypothetical protein
MRLKNCINCGSNTFATILQTNINGIEFDLAACEKCKMIGAFRTDAKVSQQVDDEANSAAV